MEDALAAKTRAVEELNRELEEIRAAFGTEGVQQVCVLYYLCFGICVSLDEVALRGLIIIIFSFN